MEPTSSCESCGDRDIEVTVVRRLYITPKSWDQEGRVVEGQVEWWCFVCRSMYPHQELDVNGTPLTPDDHQFSWSSEPPG